VSFKVILIGVGRNPERGVTVMYYNVDLISETTNLFISTTQLRFDDSFPRKGFEYLQTVLFARNWSHWPTFSRQ